MRHLRARSSPTGEAWGVHTAFTLCVVLSLFLGALIAFVAGELQDAG